MAAVNSYYDLVIIGGGINGTGIARDAAGRGLSVLLCEKNDLASATSSASSKLIHGGLRYLEQRQFSLVRKALHEREHLLHIAPHLIKPLEFILPTNQNIRSPLLIRIGLFLYDHLSMKNSLPRSKAVHSKNTPAYFTPFNSTITKGFSYYDCQVDDSRLVIENALAAKELGADIFTHARFSMISREQSEWQLRLQTQSNKQMNIRAACIVNATGAWVNETNQKLNIPLTQTIQLIKGSHIVINKRFDGQHAYILQHVDNRIIFVIPYQKNYTLIGTTDVPVKTPNDIPSIDNEEIRYLCNTYNSYFNKPIHHQDILHHWSGVRTLATTNSANPSELSRDYKLIVDNSAAPVISIYGGKITTYRILAENVLDLLSSYFSSLQPAWTHQSPLTGGNFNCIKQYEKQLQQKYSWLNKSLLKRYLSSYGSRLEKILHNCHSMSDLGENFGEQLFSKEIDYLMKEEWALSLDDILWRRTKLGLTLHVKNQKNLENYIKLHN